MQDYFDWEFYVNFYPDLQKVGIKNEKQALKHWNKRGKKEGRLCCQIPEYFDWVFYTQTYKDIDCTNEITAFEHWVTYGRKENRICRRTPEGNVQNLKEKSSEGKSLENKSKRVSENKSKRVSENKSERVSENKSKRVSENKSENLKFSIVMAYYNRKNQLKITLDQFEKIYRNKYNFEVIIVDDKSDENNCLINLIQNYNFEIKLIKISEKDWINAVVPYNIGFKNITGDIVILQNPEIFHCGDILGDIRSRNLENMYYTYPVFSSPTFQTNKIIENLSKDNSKDNSKDYYKNFVEKINYDLYDFDYNFYINKYEDLKDYSYEHALNHWNKVGIIENRQCNEIGKFIPEKVIKEWKGWYNHHIFNPRNLHFLSCFSKELLSKIGGFCPEMKNGYYHDDDDFLNRIEQIYNVNLINSNVNFGIHLYHIGGSDDLNLKKDFHLLRQHNYDIFEKNKKCNLIYMENSTENLKFEIYNNLKK